MELKEAYDRKARELAVPRKPPALKSPEAEVYPYFEAHTINNVYEADKKDDKSEEDGCNKDYNESHSFTGGITHLTCKHSIVKGFTAMKRGESVKNIVNPCITRLPARVKANRRFLLYDNACKARTYAERRFPHRVRHWTFLVDRKHWENHTTCSQSYCMDEYPILTYCHSPNSTSTQLQLNSTELGLT